MDNAGASVLPEARSMSASDIVDSEYEIISKPAPSTEAIAEEEAHSSDEQEAPPAPAAPAAAAAASAQADKADDLFAPLDVSSSLSAEPSVAAASAAAAAAPAKVSPPPSTSQAAPKSSVATPPRAAEAPAEGSQPLVVFDVHDFVGGLVPAGRVARVVYYEDPAQSAIAITTWLLPLVACTVDFGFSLVWLSSYAAAITVLALLAVSLLLNAFQRYWLKTSQPKNHIKVYLDRCWSDHADVALAYVPSQSAVVGAVDAFLQFGRTLGLQLYRALCCSSWAFSAQAVAALFMIQVLTSLVSMSFLLWLAFVSACAAPVVCREYQVPINNAIGNGRAKVAEVHSKIVSQLSKSKQS